MAYSEVGRLSDVAPGTMTAGKGKGADLLIANVDGIPYAIRRKCPHMGADLCRGVLDGISVTCPRHGATFDVRTGQVLGKASLLFVKVSVKDARAVPVRLAGDRIEALIGDASGE